MDYRKIFQASALLLLACLIAYGTGLRNGFLIDDNYLIRGNVLIKNLRFIPHLFSQPFLHSYYRPISLISFTLDYSVWKFNPFGYHLTNIFIHFLNCILILLLLNLCFKDFKLSILVSLLFAVHPLNSIAVNYISDRGNLLAGFFMLSALIAVSLAYKRPKIRFLAAGFALFFFALLSHENAVLFPLYLFCILFILYENGKGRQTAILAVSALSVSLIYLLLRLKYISLSYVIMPDFKLFFSLTSLGSFSHVIFEYLSLIIFPHNICMIRKIGPDASSGFVSILPLLLIIVFIPVLLIGFRRNRILLFASGWFLAGVLPLYNMMFYRPTMGLIMQDNWIYIPSAGLFILLSIIFLYFKKFINKRLWFLLIFCLFLFYTGKTIANNALWKDEETYCSYWLGLTSGNYIAYNALAYYHGMKQDYEKEEDYLKKAIEFNPKYAKAYNNLGVVYKATGRKEEAAALYKKAIELNPDYAEPYNNLGNIYKINGRPEEAIPLYKKAIELNQFFAEAHNNLGVAYKSIGKAEEAIASYKKAIELDPGFGRAYYNLAVIYLQKGEYKSAVEYCDKARESGFDTSALEPALK